MEAWLAPQASATAVPQTLRPHGVAEDVRLVRQAAIRPRGACVTTLASSATAVTLAAALARRSKRGVFLRDGRRLAACRRKPPAGGRACTAAARRAVVAEVATLGEVEGSQGAKPRPLQIIKIDLETNKVLLGEEEIRILEQQLKKTGVEKVAVIAVMGAFRTGKSFLLDLMLRYLREKHPQKQKTAAAGQNMEECEVPDWAAAKNVPDWAVNCGATMLEGREGRDREDLNGFIWRPGMEKCTEGIWVWSEVFVCKSGDEDVAVVLMDTQGAWDARMSKEQSATVFGLTTLLASRLVYNVSKQIQQDKIDNLLYFTEFAQAALRTLRQSRAGLKERAAQVRGESFERPFQKLEFLVRDWPHFQESFGLPEAREMMQEHLQQYFDPKLSEDTKSVDTLTSMFGEIDVWCLPHPSLAIEREGWDGDLGVMEKDFWFYIDSYMEKIFSPEELKAKANLGQTITVDQFGALLREFIAAFSDAAPQAQSFSQAMEASTSLLARDTAMKKLKEVLVDKVGKSPSAIPSEDFEALAEQAIKSADDEFSSKAIFGTDEGIRRSKEQLLEEVRAEVQRVRDDNDRKLEASLSGLTNVSLVAVGAFALDRVSDVTCDWWSDFCQEASGNLSNVYVAVLLYVGFSLVQINEKEGQLNATAAALELAKSVVKELDRFLKSLPKKAEEAMGQAQEKISEQLDKK
eukprot:TRINITY_DN79118_c0_g1_i1.p1 TRINITY_DN79118_c0_g1~~TRINITY_DN79118_c0_g1_i1.p1  ORF type:complete len:691 (+),score=172.21 TRINITY_DN79118_c0_g1_i1:94-2166(+)